MVYYRQLLLDLIQSFRSSGPERVEYLLNVIRSTDSLEEIAIALDKSIEESRREGSSSSRDHEDLKRVRAEVDNFSGQSSKKRRMVMSIQSLTDEPLFDVPAKPWTEITDDDHFVSHLVSLYFTWEHAACHIIDRDFFLEDMKCGNTDSVICTPFLVNAMLASACCFSDYPEACAVPGELLTRGEHFFAEAKRLWEKEQGVNSLANVQGLCMMTIRCKKQGNDRLGQIYFHIAAQMYASLISSRQTHLSAGNFRAANPKMQKVRSITAWSLFQINTMSAMSLFKDSNFNKDDVPRPYDISTISDTSYISSSWSPYPRHNGRRRECLEVFLNEQLKLAEICDDINHLLFRKEPHTLSINLELWRSADQAAERLHQWNDHLPESLALKDGPPHFLNLRAQYHYALISLYKFFTPGQDSALPTRITARAKELCIESARQIAALATIHGREFGFDRIYLIFAEAITIAVFVLLTDLDSEESAHAFFEAAVALRAASRRFLLAKGMMRMVQLTAYQTHITIPPRADKLFRDFGKTWKSEETKRFSSELPNIALMIRPDDANTDLIGLSALFEKWEGVSDVMEYTSGSGD